MTEEYEVEVWTENENMIEFLDNDKEATVTLHDMRLKNRVMKLAEEYPNEVTIKVMPEQNHGFLVAHVPKKWVRINPPIKREMTEEQRQALAERGRAALANLRFANGQRK